MKRRETRAHIPVRRVRFFTPNRSRAAAFELQLLEGFFDRKPSSRGRDWGSADEESKKENGEKE